MTLKKEQIGQSNEEKIPNCLRNDVKKNAEQYEVKRNERKTTPSKRSEVFLFIGTYVNFSGHVRK